MDIIETVKRFLAENRQLGPSNDALKFCADRLRLRTWYGDRFFWAITPRETALLGVNRLGLYDETLEYLNQAGEETLIFDLTIEDYRGRKPEVHGKIERISVEEALTQLMRCVTVYQGPGGYTVVHRGLAWHLRYTAGAFTAAHPPIRATWGTISGVAIPSHAVPEEVKTRFKDLLRAEQSATDNPLSLAS